MTDDAELARLLIERAHGQAALPPSALTPDTVLRRGRRQRRLRLASGTLGIALLGAGGTLVASELNHDPSHASRLASPPASSDLPALATAMQNRFHSLLDGRYKAQLSNDAVETGPGLLAAIVAQDSQGATRFVLSYGFTAAPALKAACTDGSSAQSACATRTTQSGRVVLYSNGASAYANRDATILLDDGSAYTIQEEAGRASVDPTTGMPVVIDVRPALPLDDDALASLLSDVATQRPSTS